jgi:hypothetical protein
MAAILCELADNPWGASFQFCHSASQQTRDLHFCASGARNSAEVLAPLNLYLAALSSAHATTIITYCIDYGSKWSWPNLMPYLY